MAAVADRAPRLTHVFHVGARMHAEPLEVALTGYTAVVRASDGTTRELHLPLDVDVERLTATVGDGVVDLWGPKAETPPRRPIPVSFHDGRHHIPGFHADSTPC
jgi:hypothetical protein